MHESLLTLADGRIGTRGTPLLLNGIGKPGVVLAGVYDGDGACDRRSPPSPLAEAASARLAPATAAAAARLDLRTGLLREDGAVHGRVALAFSSLARPGTVALRAVGGTELLRGRAAAAGTDRWRL